MTTRGAPALRDRLWLPFHAVRVRTASAAAHISEESS